MGVYTYEIGVILLQKCPKKWVKFFPTQTLLMHAPKFQIGICMYKCYIKITAGGQWRKENGVTEEEDWDCNVPWKLSRIYHILNRDHFAESSRTHFSSWRWWWIRYTFFVKSQHSLMFVWPLLLGFRPFDWKILQKSFNWRVWILKTKARRTLMNVVIWRKKYI